MKNYKYLLLVSTCLLFNNNSLASELDLTFKPSSSPFGIHISDTHTPVGLKPISNLNANSGIKLAAVCAVAGGGCDGIGFGSSNNDMNLDNNAQCRDEGFGTTCGYGYVPDTSQKCPYNGAFFKCRVCSHSCSSGSLSYCSSSQVETGSSRNDCNETCYTCRMKTCEEGGYASSINSCQKASTVSFAGKTCYTSIAGKSCTDGGYVASIPANNTCSSTSYCGNTCYHSCSQPTCAVGGFRDAIPANNTCASTTYYGRTCYKDCYQPNCGAGGYNASIPANNLCSAVNYYGQTCYQNCYQPACSSGGFVDSCPANQIGTAVSHYGRTCYKGCYQPACSSGGYVDSCPSGQTGTATTYYGRTCYSGCKNNDYGYCDVGTILYADKRCSNKIISSNTPIAVVFDTYGRLALALVDKSRASWGCYGDVRDLEGCSDSNVYYCNTDGKYNTTKIVNSCGMSAASICNDYSTAGTRNGDWFLPSMLELDYFASNRNKINATLSKLGAETLKDDFYWSSNPSLLKGYAWKLNFRSGTADFQSQYESNYIRPVIKF